MAVMKSPIIQPRLMGVRPRIPCSSRSVPSATSRTITPSKPYRVAPGHKRPQGILPADYSTKPSIARHQLYVGGYVFNANVAIEHAIQQP